MKWEESRIWTQNLELKSCFHCLVVNMAMNKLVSMNLSILLYRIRIKSMPHPPPWDYYKDLVR